MFIINTHLQYLQLDHIVFLKHATLTTMINYILYIFGIIIRESVTETEKRDY